LLGRLLWALGNDTEAGQGSCRVSGPVYTPEWHWEGACPEWEGNIDDLIASDPELSSARSFVDRWTILQNRVLGDANASYQLCKREHAFCENAVKLYQDAALRGNIEAQFRLGAAYSRWTEAIGSRVDPQDEAISWLRRAAERDHVEAQWELANQ
jgi:TPR repeat protein